MRKLRLGRGHDQAQPEPIRGLRAGCAPGGREVAGVAQSAAGMRRQSGDPGEQGCERRPRIRVGLQQKLDPSLGVSTPVLGIEIGKDKAEFTRPR